jgi:F-type H+-transporting ATPase subunit gamma
MANLKDIRRRIRSVKNMQQITKAMKMVSAAKLRRAQERVVEARPYADAITRVLEGLAAQTGDYRHPLLEPRGDDTYLVVLITADKGLCGAYNTNLIKAASVFIRQHPDQHVSMVPVGRRGRDFFRRRAVEMPAQHVNVVGKALEYQVAAGIGREIIDLFLNEELGIDRVFVIYNEFRSALSQDVIVKQLLPIGDLGGTGDAGSAEPGIDYLYEQPPEEIFGRLLPRFVETQIYYAMLEAIASEHGARMTAMDSASKNAADVIDRLTLFANRVRQASITNEIIEVVGGAAALG